MNCWIVSYYQILTLVCVSMYRVYTNVTHCTYTIGWNKGIHVCVYIHMYILLHTTLVYILYILTQTSGHTYILSYKHVHTLSCSYPSICLPTYIYIWIHWNVPLEISSAWWIMASAKQASDRSLLEALQDSSWHEHLNYKNVNFSDQLKIWGALF